MTWLGSCRLPANSEGLIEGLAALHKSFGIEIVKAWKDLICMVWHGKEKEVYMLDLSLINTLFLRLPFWLKIQSVITQFDFTWSTRAWVIIHLRAMDHSMGFPPAALNKQQKILESRFPPTGRSAQTQEDDMRSNAGSISSWINVPADDGEESDGLEFPPGEQLLPHHLFRQQLL